MFKGQPKGLYALALANTGERFGYYTMLAVFALFLRANFGLEAGVAGAIYSTFLGLVYFMPLVGGVLADKFGYGKMVTIGITVMFAGYLLLSLPLGSDTLAMIGMLAALIFISVGTGLFKGNLQVMVGNLYDDPKYASKRDEAFSIFYMAINVGPFSLRRPPSRSRSGLRRASGSRRTTPTTSRSPWRAWRLSSQWGFITPSAPPSATSRAARARAARRPWRRKTFGWRDAPAYHRPLPRFRRGDFLLDGFPPEWADTDLLRQ